MIDPLAAQDGLITYLKAQASLTALLASADEIREQNWQGDVFDYPNLRVRLGTLYPIADCNTCRSTLSVQSFSEDASSREAMDIANEVNQKLHNKTFTRGSVRYFLYSTGVLEPVRQDERTWRSETQFKMILDPAS